MFTKLSRKEEGFTLIELLVVVAIIALLAAFAVPRLFDAITTARKAPGTADVQTIASAIERYNFEEDQGSSTPQRYPTGLSQLNGKYLKTGTVFKNGFGKGYIYVTNATGSAYVLVNPADADDTATVPYRIQCGATIVKGEGTAGDPFIRLSVDNTGITTGNIPVNPSDCQFRVGTPSDTPTTWTEVPDSKVWTY